MKKINKWGKLFILIMTVLFVVSMLGCKSTSEKAPAEVPNKNKVVSTQLQVIKGKNYSTKDEVATYINQFHLLPPNYIIKKEAEKQGWDNYKGNLWKITNQKSIGGDRFGNREGVLPKAKGRQYYECDIDYKGGYRGAKRIVYSNDGLIFYTEDHYKTFTQLY